MPNTIDYDIQRCKELANGIRNAKAIAGVCTRTEDRSDCAILLLEPLANVLAELERLRAMVIDHNKSVEALFGGPTEGKTD